MSTSKEHETNRITTAAAVLIILLFSLFYSSISLWDPDFWWHINSGKYIVEHAALPDEDPFTFSPAAKDVKINISTLKGYWLAQIILYGIWKTGGVVGIVIVRVVVLALTLFLVWRFMRRGRPYLRLSGLLLAGNTLFYFTGERPQLFVFPLAILLFMIAEAYLENRSKSVYLLPVVTLLWTNLHRSSLFAVAVIVIYAVGSLISSSYALSRREKVIFLVICFLSIIMTFISPTGIYKVAELDVFGQNIQTASTIEFLSPFKLYSSYGKLYPSYWICLLLTIFLLIANLRRIPVNVTLVLTATSVLSLTGARYMVFLTLAGSLLFRLSQIRLNGYVQKAVMIAALLPVVLNIGYFRPFNFTIRETYPFESVSLLRDEHPKRVFAYLDWGGFIGYMLPGTEVFMDGKILSRENLAQYEATLSGTEAMGQKEWKNNLNRYEVDAVVLPLRDLNTGRPIELVERLSDDSDWKKVYLDDKQTLFVKRVKSD